MLDLVQTLFAFIVALGLLIFVHEFGHFWVARRCGVKVLKFSIGFGKPLVTWHDKQGTEFCIASLPLGGYVKMLGEGGSDVTAAELKQSFAHKSVYQRFAIVSAGPLINLLFAVAVYWLLFVVGVTSLAPYVGDIKPGSQAEQAGFLPLDEVRAVNGKSTQSWDDITIALVSYIGEDAQFQFEVMPDGGSSTVIREIEVTDWMSDNEKEHPLKLLGMAPYFPKVPAVIGELVPGKAAARQGLQPGDQVVAVNDVAIETWDEWVSLIKKNPETTMNVTLERSGSELTLPITPDRIKAPDGAEIGQIGAHLQSGLAEFPDFMVRKLQYGPIAAVGQALDYAWSRISLTITSVVKMVTGTISVENLSGPITIAKIAGDSAEYGLESFFNFIAYLSISLGVLNLLPIPVLDGGHLVYYLVEMVKGSPVPEKIQAFGNSIGLTLLMMFMGLAFYNDFMGL